MYKYLGAKGSVFQIRLILIGICAILFTLFVSMIDDTNNTWAFAFLGYNALFSIGLICYFSVVKYNHSEIVIVNILGETRYRKADLKTISPIVSFLPLYTIVFKGEKSYHFSTASGRIIGFTDAKKEADQIKMELLCADRQNESTKYLK